MLGAILRTLEIEADLIPLARQIISPRESELGPEGVDSSVLGRANETYRRLTASAANIRPASQPDFN